MISYTKIPRSPGPPSAGCKRPSFGLCKSFFGTDITARELSRELQREIDAKYAVATRTTEEEKLSGESESQSDREGVDRRE